MIPKAHIEDSVAQIVAVEEEPEGVDDTITFVDDDKYDGGVAAAALCCS